jgi:DNA-binding PadR family transcriptional regulator
VGDGPRRRRYYHLTTRGAAVLDVLRETVVELHHEVVEEATAKAPRKPFRLASASDGHSTSVKKRPAAGRKARPRQ